MAVPVVRNMDKSKAMRQKEQAKKSSATNFCNKLAIYAFSIPRSIREIGPRSSVFGDAER
jgi:hypothetical protein